MSLRGPLLNARLTAQGCSHELRGEARQSYSGGKMYLVGVINYFHPKNRPLNVFSFKNVNNKPLK